MVWCVVRTIREEFKNEQKSTPVPVQNKRQKKDNEFILSYFGIFYFLAAAAPLLFFRLFS